MYANNHPNWNKPLNAEYSEDCGLVGVEEFHTSDFQLYPIPTENNLNIQSKTQVESVKIYSIQGILVNEYFTNTFDVSQLTPGIYFVEVTMDGRRGTKKFIKM